MRIASCLATLFICWGQVARAAPVDLKNQPLEQVFARLLPDMASPDPKVCAAAQQKWQDICLQAGAPGNETRRAEACKLMADRLGVETPARTRIWLLKQLEWIGREECIDAVAAVLVDQDEHVRDAAVRCLAASPAPQATAKLLTRLTDATGKTKIGLLNALGYRGDEAAVALVAKELVNSEEPVVIAAAQALGRIATPEATRALSLAKTKAKGKAHLAISHALLACADRYRNAGKNAEAKEIYQALSATAVSAPYRPIRSAALLGLIRCAGNKATEKVQELLNSADAEERMLAAGEIANLDPAALASLAATLEKMPVSNQVLVLDTLADRGDKSLAFVALAAARSKEESLKRAGVRALGRLGDASSVPLLIEVLDSPGLQGAAVNSLAQLNVEGVDGKLIAVLKTEKNARKLVALIEVVERRRSTEAVPALLQLARSAAMPGKQKRAAGSEDRVRVSAFSALGGLADSQHIPQLVQVLLELNPGADRDAAEKCIVAVSARIPDPDRRAAAVLEAIKDADESRRRALLPLLGRLGGPQAREETEKSLKTANRATFAAAAQALCRWPDASASDRLLWLAQNPEWKNSAIQALVRINTLKDNRPAEQKLAVLKKTMEMAETNSQRKVLIEGLGTVRHIDAFRFVVPYLDNKELAQSACKALVGLARSTNLHQRHREEVDKVLDRVISISQDKVLIDLAKQYKQRLPKGES